jgi:DNA polymerase III epsilon subunit-like protein
MLTHAQHMQPWWQLPLLCLDFETTDADPFTCMPVEIALVRFELGEPVQSWSTLINPLCPISQGATDTHGLVAEDVREAPCFDDAWSDACDRFALADAVPVAYNAPFDRRILHRLAPAASGHALPILDADLNWIDPLVIVRDVDKYAPGKGRHRLENAIARHGIATTGNHRALADAEAAGRLLFKFKERIGDMTVSELLRKQAVRAAAQERERAEWIAKQPPAKAEGAGATHG